MKQRFIYFSIDWIEQKVKNYIGDSVQKFPRQIIFSRFSCQNIDAASVSLNNSIAASIIKAVLILKEKSRLILINNKIVFPLYLTLSLPSFLLEYLA